MNDIENWPLIKRTLGRASVALEELLMAAQLNDAPSRTQDNLLQTFQGIRHTLSDENALREVAEVLNYQELVKKLEAEDYEITDEMIDRARSL